MHHTAQYNFPAPIITGRQTSAMAATGHYNSYDPRTTVATAAAVSAPLSAPAPATPTRSSNRTSSEFRGSTNPSEDWTKISDLAERRRIQNRIAQRNYRKKLKRRLEDLERRAQSRSLSPNGEESGDGRSTRESSSDNQNANAGKSMPSASSISSTTATATTADTITVSAHPTTSAYEYASTYSATTSSTPYPSQYRTAGGYASSANSPPTHYTTTNAYDPQITYSSYESHQPHHGSHLPPLVHHQNAYQSTHYTTPDSAVDPNLLLPLPPLMSHSTSTTPSSSVASSPATRSIPGTTPPMTSLKTQGLYDLENAASPASSSASAVSPYVLTHSYDSISEHYHYSPAGVGSAFYNLDYAAPLPPLLGHHGASSGVNNPATPSSATGRYIKKEAW